MRIAVLGTGAVGSLFAAALARLPGNEVLCIVQSREHAELINAEGITIAGADGGIEYCGAGYAEAPQNRAAERSGMIVLGGSNQDRGLSALTDTNGEKAAELVMVAVKGPDTAAAVSQHAELFGPDTTVLTLQNGYGNHNDLLQAAARDHILIGTTAEGANIAADGTVVHAGRGATVIGALVPESAEAADRAGRVCELLNAAGFSARVTSDAMDAVLGKLFINVGINALCTLNDVCNSAVCDDPEIRERAHSLVCEAVDVVNYTRGRTAGGAGRYDREEIWQSVERTARATGANVCSMLQDARRSRRTEIARINGAIVEMAREAGCDAPLNRSVVSEVESRFGV